MTPRARRGTDNVSTDTEAVREVSIADTGSEPSKAPTVSIGIPVYNGASHIGETIESILSQTFRDFELLISDNASTDGTFDICHEYASRDQRVRCVRQSRNLGANKNFNTLFEMSSGKYFKWSGYDDRLDPTLIERCVEALEGNPAASIAYCGETFIDDESGTEVLRCDVPHNIHGDTSDARFREWMWNMEIKNQGMSDLVYGVVRSEAMRNTRLFIDKLATNKILILELVTKGPVIHIPDVLVFRSPPGHRTIEQRMARLAPMKNSRVSLPHWATAVEFFRVAWGLDISLSRRISLVLDCLKFFATGRRLHNLIWDVRRTALYLTKTSTPSEQGV